MSIFMCSCKDVWVRDKASNVSSVKECKSVWEKEKKQMKKETLVLAHILKFGIF
jgi:hypothetical protein